MLCKCGIIVRVGNVCCEVRDDCVVFVCLMHVSVYACRLRDCTLYISSSVILTVLVSHMYRLS